MPAINILGNSQDLWLIFGALELSHHCGDRAAMTRDTSGDGILA